MQKTLSEILYCITDEIDDLETQTEEARDLANIGYLIECADIGLEMKHGAQFNAIWDRTINSSKKIKQIKAYVEELKNFFA